MRFNKNACATVGRKGKILYVQVLGSR